MPRKSTEAFGSSVTSAPESISSGTSASVAPLSEFRSMTFATGAGGEKKLLSYAGIVCFLDHLFDKVNSLFRVFQAWAANKIRRLNLKAWDDNINSRFLRQAKGVRQFDLPVFDDGFKSSYAHNFASIPV